jgi:hypothetical protein
MFIFRIKNMIIITMVYDQFKIALVSSHFKEDISWLRESLQTYTQLSVCIYDCEEDASTIPNDIASDNRVHIKSKKKLRSQFYYYIDYIVENYDSLPDYVLFHHSHDQSWHQKLPMNRILEHLHLLQPFNYINISDNIFPDWIELRYDKMIGLIQKTLEEEPLLLKCFPSLAKQDLQVYELNAGQACVHKSNILKTPKTIYTFLANILKKYEFHNDLAFEGLFHVFMGEQLARPYIKTHYHELVIRNGKNGQKNELQLRLIDYISACQKLQKCTDHYE